MRARHLQLEEKLSKIAKAAHASAHLVHSHARRIPVVTEADDDNAILFGENRLIDLPPIVKMRQQVRHCCYYSTCQNIRFFVDSRKFKNA